MKTLTAVLAFITSLGAGGAFAQDWPQWRGANRDAHASDFKAPKSWPKELTQKWKVTVGDGVATPALVGDKLYVFSRDQGNEVLRALNAADGKELWQEKYEALGASGAAAQQSGPRSSPAVSGGKVVTVGVRGMVSVVDAATGKKLWRKDEFASYPQFFHASSPMIVDGLVIAQLGGNQNGAVVAYDLASGNEKWKWSGPSPAYASPVLMTVGGTKLVIAQTQSKLVAVNAADGKLEWEEAGAAGGGGGGGRGMGGGMGGGYKAATPIVDGTTLITGNSGLKALKFSKDGGKISATELWRAEKTVQFNTPALKNEMLYGLAGNNDLFAINVKDGSTAWSAPWPSAAGGPNRAALEKLENTSQFFGLVAQDPPPGQGRRGGGGRFGGPGGQGGGGRFGGQGGQGGQGFQGGGAPGAPGAPGGGRRGGGMGGGMGGGGGYGSIVNADSVLLALTTSAQLLVLEPSATQLKQIASYKVSSSQTHAYPVASGNRIFIKDRDSVTLWTVE
jgi:outer membrane protein assembly factor BamB